MLEAYDPETFRARGHALVDHLADHLARASAGALLVVPWAPPRVNVEAWARVHIVCFRHGEDDRAQEEIRRAVLEDGRFYVVKTRLRGKTFLRVTIINPRTTADDLARLIDVVRTFGQR
jgi:hypothetical protein